MKLAIASFTALLITGCSFEGSNKMNITSSDTEVDPSNLEKTIDYMSSYSIIDKEHGTKTTVELKGNMRVMTTNALPNHETGTFPNKNNPNKITPQKITYQFPLNPINTGKAKWAREPGIALNGIKFEPETAEQLICETGKDFRIKAKEGLIDLGMDKNNSQVPTTGPYHDQGVPN